MNTRGASEKLKKGAAPEDASPTRRSARNAPSTPEHNTRGRKLADNKKVETPKGNVRGTRANVSASKSPKPESPATKKSASASETPIKTQTAPGNSRATRSSASTMINTPPTSTPGRTRGVTPATHSPEKADSTKDNKTGSVVLPQKVEGGRNTRKSNITADETESALSPTKSGGKKTRTVSTKPEISKEEIEEEKESQELTTPLTESCDPDGKQETASTVLVSSSLVDNADGLTPCVIETEICDMIASHDEQMVESIVETEQGQVTIVTSGAGFNDVNSDNMAVMETEVVTTTTVDEPMQQELSCTNAQVTQPDVMMVDQSVPEDATPSIRNVTIEVNQGDINPASSSGPAMVSLLKTPELKTVKERAAWTKYKDQFKDLCAKLQSEGVDVVVFSKHGQELDTCATSGGLDILKELPQLAGEQISGTSRSQEQTPGPSTSEPSQGQAVIQIVEDTAGNQQQTMATPTESHASVQTIVMESGDGGDKVPGNKYIITVHKQGSELIPTGDTPTPVRRGRGRPRKYPLLEGSTPVVKKPPVKELEEDPEYEAISRKIKKESLACMYCEKEFVLSCLLERHLRSCRKAPNSGSQFLSPRERSALRREREEQARKQSLETAESQETSESQKDDGEHKDGVEEAEEEEEEEEEIEPENDKDADYVPGAHVNTVDEPMVDDEEKKSKKRKQPESESLPSTPAKKQATEAASSQTVVKVVSSGSKDTSKGQDELSTEAIIQAVNSLLSQGGKLPQDIIIQTEDGSNQVYVQTSEDGTQAIVQQANKDGESQTGNLTLGERANIMLSSGEYVEAIVLEDTVPSIGPPKKNLIQTDEQLQDILNSIPIDKLECNICNRKFKDNKYLLRHMVVHSAKKNRFSCSICHKRFTRKYDLHVHYIRIHNWVKSGRGKVQDEISLEEGEIVMDTTKIRNKGKKNYEDSEEREEGQAEDEEVQRMEEENASEQQGEEESNKTCDTEHPTEPDCSQEGGATEESRRSLEDDKSTAQTGLDDVPEEAVKPDIKPEDANVAETETKDEHIPSTEEKEVAISKEKTTHEQSVQTPVEDGEFEKDRDKNDNEEKDDDEEEVSDIMEITADEDVDDLYQCLDAEPGKCKHCDVTLETIKEVVDHYTEAHNHMPVFTCSICKTDCTSFHNLRRHFLFYHVEKKFWCQVCGKKFRMQKLLDLHRTQKHGETSSSYICNFCSKRFKNRYYLNKHMMKHSEFDKKGEAKKYMCTICKLHFQWLPEFQSHMKHHQDDTLRTFQCDKCPKRFFKVGHLRRHLVTHSSERPYLCRMTGCGRSFKDTDSLRKHEKFFHVLKDQHADPTAERFLCNQCGKVFFNINHLKRHKFRHSGIRPFSCEHCGKAFAEKKSLENHVRIHTGERPYQCQDCGRRFVQMSHLNRHRFLHTQVRNFECPECHKKFFERTDVEKHMRVHSKVRPFKCDLCDMSFTQRNILICHRRRHTGEKPYVCDICSRSFTQLGSLQTHRRLHTGERPYKCMYCDMGFVSKERMKFHSYVHTGITPHICHICGKGFRMKYKLQTHLDSHEGVYRHKCAMCDKAFLEKCKLNRHMKQVHNEDFPDARIISVPTTAGIVRLERPISQVEDQSEDTMEQEIIIQNIASYDVKEATEGEVVEATYVVEGQEQSEEGGVSHITLSGSDAAANLAALYESGTSNITLPEDSIIYTEGTELNGEEVVYVVIPEDNQTVILS